MWGRVRFPLSRVRAVCKLVFSPLRCLFLPSMITQTAGFWLLPDKFLVYQGLSVGGKKYPRLLAGGSDSAFFLERRGGDNLLTGLWIFITWIFKVPLEKRKGNTLGNCCRFFKVGGLKPRKSQGQTKLHSTPISTESKSEQEKPFALSLTWALCSAKIHQLETHRSPAAPELFCFHF